MPSAGRGSLVSFKGSTDPATLSPQAPLFTTNCVSRLRLSSTSCDIVIPKERGCTMQRIAPMFRSQNSPSPIARSLLIAALLLLQPAATTLAQASESNSADHAGIGRDITVAEGETAGDIACAFCSVRIHGDVRGDVAVLFGSITVDPDRNVSGDIAILGGDLSLRDDSQVG